MIKLPTLDMYEFSEHHKSIHQWEIRRPMCFILLLLKNSIKLLAFKHGIKQFSKTHICVTIKGEKIVFMDLFYADPTKVIQHTIISS